MTLVKKSDMIAKELEGLIDLAVSRDFILHDISEEDRQIESYKALKFALNFNDVDIQYERKVESEKHPIIPKFQFLFGFVPKDGMCLFVNKKEHKIALCDGPLEAISQSCSSIHSLLYLLVPTYEFEVYTYMPACCEINCVNSPKQYNLRINLFEKES